MRFNAETQRRGDKRGENQNESKPESAEGAEVCRLAQRGCAWSRDTLGLPRESCGALRRPGLRGLAQRAPRRAYPAASDLVGIFRFSTSVSDGAAIGAIRSPPAIISSNWRSSRRYPPRRGTTVKLLRACGKSVPPQMQRILASMKTCCGRAGPGGTPVRAASLQFESSMRGQAFSGGTPL